jgi:hypothetical protein
VSALSEQHDIDYRPFRGLEHACSKFNFQMLAGIAVKSEIIQNTKMLLRSLNTGDFKTFSKLCEPEMTSFQPETVGNLVQGINFYKFYFDSQKW